jgi:hypothetical protein
MRPTASTKIGEICSDKRNGGQFVCPRIIPRSFLLPRIRTMIAPAGHSAFSLFSFVLYANKASDWHFHGGRVVKLASEKTLGITRSWSPRIASQHALRPHPRDRSLICWIYSKVRGESVRSKFGLLPVIQELPTSATPAPERDSRELATAHITRVHSTLLNYIT